jgi:hypothetical protein
MIWRLRHLQRLKNNLVPLMLISRQRGDEEVGFLTSRISEKISNEISDFSHEINKLNECILYRIEDSSLCTELKNVMIFLTLNQNQKVLDVRQRTLHECCVCYEFMMTPVKLRCEHTICGDCFDKWYIRAKKCSCPMCRNQMGEEYRWSQIYGYYHIIL